ncbi:arginine metabolism transcriptional control protein [Rhodotorula toruloides]|uniref:Kinase n=1 Tax=Rhodotorula toruloides TaxID=5286 RepID=A0A511KD48_RHOTO|nr:arginine metabolism transcriptional control protein [Rhodotorula toruloides]
MAFAHQVGGHAATILASPIDASTLIKPASARELAFYTQIAPTLADGTFLGEWTPAFYGRLKLEGKIGQSDAVEKLDMAGDEEGELEPEMLVLENLTYRFVRPNVLDIKLGTQLVDEDASEEKKARMTKAAAASTSGETGIRLTGFQVWDTASQEYIPTAKPYGRSLKATELPSGIARFFYPPLSSLSQAEKEALGVRSAPIASSSSFATSAISSATSATPAPLPLDLLLPVLRTLLRQLDELITVFSTLEIRMRGGSLLIVVEGDPSALEAALLRSMGDDDDDDSASVSTTDGEGNAKPHTRLAYEMRLIDFAHTRAAPGEGPDEGVLKGLQTVKALLEDLTRRLTEKQKGAEA